MRVFVDECVTTKFMPQLIGHDFVHISDTPWRGMKNGALLRLVESEFDVFLTTDRQLPRQQNLRNFNLVLVIVHGISNYVEDLLPLLADIHGTLDKIASRRIRPDVLHEVKPAYT